MKREYRKFLWIAAGYAAVMIMLALLLLVR